MSFRIEEPQSIAMGEDFALIESLLWDRTLHRENDHLERLYCSAREFEMPMDRRFVRATLRQYCRTITEQKPFKVRVLLHSSGELQINHQILEDRKFGRAALARQRVYSANPFLYHKSNRRDLFNAIYSRASLLQYDDVIFFNERNELTEGCIHNVFIEKDGMLLTPPINCGLLPGVYRRNILAKNKRAKERILTRNDIIEAKRIYLCNSVRGMYMVKVNAETEI